MCLQFSIVCVPAISLSSLYAWLGRRASHCELQQWPLWYVMSFEPDSWIVYLWNESHDRAHTYIHSTWLCEWLVHENVNIIIILLLSQLFDVFVFSPAADISKMMEIFTTSRSTLPSMVLATPYDKCPTPWTTPTSPLPPVAGRLQLLAKESLKLLTHQLNPDVPDLDIRVCVIHVLYGVHLLELGSFLCSHAASIQTTTWRL